ncbi:HAMP domain-containing protein [Tychonema sp. LEGE 07199]|uniref:sensor histidine kinase n=1 Tax=unclassified Tychonema TaxID=2642144 RepID=UPI0018818DCF|nr:MULTISPECIES: HAMP domain-containing sensor histidine kinase [unclassified Tychonema]MBE9122191.1 HAMP domain-containing protein [Tychonema sp. LEGE 07199]MBE9133787.1 HAMP domain-containing protein [Tychonema sp. LEGE 07196]
MQLKHHKQVSQELPTSFQYKIKQSHLLKLNYFAQIARSFGNLSISDKISRGYALALCVAIGGTTIGMLAGNHYYRRTNNQLHIDRESQLLNKLQVALLRTQNSQQRLIDGIEQPESFDSKYQQLQKNIYSLKLSLSEVTSQKEMEQAAGLQGFIKKYNSLLSNYIQQLETVNAQISKLPKSPDQKSVRRKLLLNFDRDKLGLKLERATNDLGAIIDRAQEQENAAREALLRAQTLRVQIIFGSMALSIVIAALLASFTSRAIAKPLAAVTKIAQRVTEESNFQLQVPVTSTDEVGVLAASFNQLIQKVNHLLVELKSEQEIQILQNEKMATLGRMLAGVAHEVNNPINFIYANIDPAKTYVEDLLDLLKTYETEIPNPPAAVTAKAEAIDIDFLQEDLMKIFNSMQVGAERAKAIILSLKDFSRLDDAAPQPVDLHACIDSSLLILNSRVKQGVEVVRNYGDIPKIEGYMGLLYQVFVNLIGNALDAVEEKAKVERISYEEANKKFGSESKKSEKSSFSPKILITTEYLDDDSVVVRISDNGTGIPAASQERMFETFFTTKPRGVGTGLGLAIGREIIVNKHGGTINCWSEMGTGTEFAIALPIKH